MRSKWNSLVVGSCNVFGLALLVLSATGGGSAVRAGDPSSNVLEKIIAGIEQRVAGLEASVAAFADSFTARRIAAQELCVGDGSGAQTCITRAQLDALLRGATQTGQAPAAIEPDETEQAASADTSIAPIAAAATPSETPPAIEPSGAPLAIPQTAEGRGGEAAQAMPEVAAAPEVAATPAEIAAAPEVAATPEIAAVPEAAAAPQVEAVPEAEAALPSATQPATEQPTAALSEAGAPLSAEAAVPPPVREPAETVIAASSKPDAPITAEPPAKDEEPAQTGSLETTPGAPQAKAAPAEVPPVSERAE
jgi:hypothetical protein